MGAPPTLILFFTRFPVATETFLQREVEALRDLGVQLELWSFWEGDDAFAGLSIRRMPLWRMLSLFFWLPYWMLCAPRATLSLLKSFCSRRPPNRINWGENLLGLGCGFCLARAFTKRNQPFVLHAVWGSLPATVAWTISRLTGLPFTFAAHAYDLFEDGGDGLLREKCLEAEWIRTSTQAGVARLTEKGAATAKISVIRRGLIPLPKFQPREVAQGGVIHILSVGRLVEKMGYLLQMDVYAELKRRQIPFLAEIVGEGPLRAVLIDRISRLGLENEVTLCGALPFGAVTEKLSSCGVALFTGIVAESGDRAGFPNFVGEAMAYGAPVVCTPVGAVTEVVSDGVNGRIARDPAELAHALAAMASKPEETLRQVQAARKWVEENFDARANMERFRQALRV